MSSVSTVSSSGEGVSLRSYDEAVRQVWRPLAVDGGLRELVRAGTLAANSHNTQPWRFSLADNAVAIHPDLTRRCPAVDPDDHHLFASLGCAVENIVQAAPVLSFDATPAPNVSNAVLTTPFAVRLLRDAEAPADLPHCLALSKTDLRLAQSQDDLLGRLALQCHFLVSVRELGNSQIRYLNVGSD